MAVNIQMYLIFAFITHEIFCRTIDSKTVPTVINVLNHSNTIMENSLSNTTESATAPATAIPITTDESNSLDICEYFDSSYGLDLGFRDHEVTVITRLF